MKIIFDSLVDIFELQNKSKFIIEMKIDKLKKIEDVKKDGLIFDFSNTTFFTSSSLILLIVIKISQLKE